MKLNMLHHLVWKVLVLDISKYVFVGLTKSNKNGENELSKLADRSAINCQTIPTFNLIFFSKICIMC